MRALYVPVRLAVTVVAVAAVAGCMSVGDDGEGGGAKPSHSAGRHGNEAPDGGTGLAGGGSGIGAAGDAKHGGRKGHGKPGESASPSASPSADASASAPVKGKPGRTEKPGDPAPTKAPPTPTQSEQPPPASPEPPPPASPEPPPPSAEPSSSAHPEAGPQLVDREPAPTAGTPA
ncbi:hypothetical protein ACWD5F_20080 [Streptomyces sp. NPDC002499]